MTIRTGRGIWRLGLVAPGSRLFAWPGSKVVGGSPARVAEAFAARSRSMSATAAATKPTARRVSPAANQRRRGCPVRILNVRCHRRPDAHPTRVQMLPVMAPTDAERSRTATARQTGRSITSYRPPSVSGVEVLLQSWQRRCNCRDNALSNCRTARRR
jgi:hypothetical protein